MKIFILQILGTLICIAGIVVGAITNQLWCTIVNSILLGFSLGLFVASIVFTAEYKENE